MYFTMVSAELARIIDLLVFKVTSYNIFKATFCIASGRLKYYISPLNNNDSIFQLQVLLGAIYLEIGSAPLERRDGWVSPRG